MDHLKTVKTLACWCNVDVTMLLECLSIQSMLAVDPPFINWGVIEMIASCTFGNPLFFDE